MAGRRRPTGPFLGLLLLAGTIASPVAADETGPTRVRLTTDQLDLVFTLEGATPVAWRACYPACAQADGASGATVRFTGADDPPQARLVLRGPGPAVDLQRLRFTAVVTEDARARRVTFQSDVPGARVRLVKSFEVSKEARGRDDRCECSDRDAAAFMTDRRLDLELDAGRDLLPPPAAGFAALLERVQRVVVADARVAFSAPTAEIPCPIRAGDWAGVRSPVLGDPPASGRDRRPHAALGRGHRPGVRRRRRRCRGATPSIPGRWSAVPWLTPDPSLEPMLFSGLWSWLRALSLALPVPAPRADRDRRRSRRGDHRPGGIGQDSPPALDGRGRAAAGAGQHRAGAAAARHRRHQGGAPG